MITADFKLKCQTTSFVCHNSYNKDFVAMTIKKSLTSGSAQNFPHHFCSLFFLGLDRLEAFLSEEIPF